MVASTLLVQADLSGTTYAGAPTLTDVTRFVRLVDGIDITSWRQDSLTEISPTQFALTLDNETLPGDATAPNAGRFTPGLSTSPWSGKLLPGVRFRISETVGGTTYTLADGYATDWSTQPSDDGAFPVTRVNCIDIFGWMGTLQPLRSIYDEEVLLDAPSHFYPCDDDTASKVAANVAAANNPSASVLIGKFGGSFTFGYSTVSPTVTAATSLQLKGAASPASGKTSAYVATGIKPANAAGFTVEMIVKIDAANATFAGAYLATILDPNGFILTGTSTYLVADTGGLTLQITDGIVATPASIAHGGPNIINDGLFHHLVFGLQADGKTPFLYIDNVARPVGAAASATLNWKVSSVLDIGVRNVNNYGGWDGEVAKIAYYPAALSAARITAHYTAKTTAFAGERTDTHLARLLGYRPNLGSSLAVGLGTVGVHDTAGATLQRALLDTAKAEGGLVYADGTGQIIFLNRARNYDPVVAASLDVEADLTSDYQVRIDNQRLLNDVTVSRTNGADQRIVNTASQAIYGPRQQTLTLIVNSDRDAADAAGWTVANQKTAAVRTPAITADITTMTSTSQAQAVLARTPLDRVTLTNLPSWAPPTDVTIQGRKIRIDDSGPVVSFFTDNLPRGTLRADAAASANTKLDNGLVIPW